MSTLFRDAVRRLDRAGRLIKVARPVSQHEELAGILRRFDGDKAFLFESVSGSDMAVVGNLLASPLNVQAALAAEPWDIRKLMVAGLGQPIPPEVVVDPPVQQHVVDEPLELGALLPVLAHAPGDGGRFITAGVVIVRDPETGVHNASYHRFQLLRGNRTAVRLDHGRHLRAAHDRACQLGRSLPISVCLGTDLALMYASALMGSQMPETGDELAAAGGIKGAPLAVAPALTQDILVAAESEIVLEGEISPTETVHEGPFAEFVGYHSDEGPAPVVTFTGVTHRPEPLYHAINGAGRETVMLRKYTLEASALQAAQAAVPIVTDVEMTAGGLHRFHIIIQVNKSKAQHEGLQRNAMLAAFAALKDLDLAIVVDDDIDIRDPADVEYALATRFEASRDMVLIPGARGHEYVRVSAGGIRTKLGLDATVAVSDRERFRRASFADVQLEETDKRTEPGSSRLSWLND